MCCNVHSRGHVATSNFLDFGGDVVPNLTQSNADRVRPSTLIALAEARISKFVDCISAAMKSLLIVLVMS